MPEQGPPDASNQSSAPSQSRSLAIQQVVEVVIEEVILWIRPKRKGQRVSSVRKHEEESLAKAKPFQLLKLSHRLGELPEEPPQKEKNFWHALYEMVDKSKGRGMMIDSRQIKLSKYELYYCLSPVCW